MDGRESAADSTTLQRVRLTSSLRRKGIRDARILNAIGEIPREQFVDGSLRSEAYRDNPLPIGEGQTISQPYVVALMAEALSLTGKRTRPRNRHRFRLSDGNPLLFGTIDRICGAFLRHSRRLRNAVYAL